MAVSSVRVVVWEWQRDDGGFSPYYPEVSQAIENAWKSGQTVLNLGSVSSPLAHYKVDLVKKQQTRNDTGMARDVQRSEIDISASPCHGLWEWRDGLDHYNIYSIAAMVEIEEAYSFKQLSVDLSRKPSHLPYTIDFTTMYQTRHHFGTKRKIKRTKLPKSLQSYLAIDISSLNPTASSGLMTNAAGGLSLDSPGSLARVGTSAAFNTHLLPSGTSSVYTVSLPSVYPSLESSTSFSSVTTFDTSHYKTPRVSSLPTPKATSSVHPTTTTASTAKTKATSSSSKSRKGGSNKKTNMLETSVPVINLTSDSSGRVTNKSAKRCRTKVEKPKGALFSSDMPFLNKVSHVKKKDDGPCPICMSELSEASGFSEGPLDTSGVYKLSKCGHMLHTPCVKAYIKNSSSSKGSFQCPTCKKIYGIKTGDMPPGSMSVSRMSSSLPGHHGYGTIQIVYSFRPGVHLGKRYVTNGFPRTCYVPDSPQGQKVLKLLQRAWDRKLTFTIGTSVTTGASNTLVWNEIHHKTESTTNHSGHGYPDPNYLDNVTAELAAQGVEDSDDNENDESDKDSNSSSDNDL